MTQLPPKAPSMTQNWPSFPHQMMPMSMGRDVISTPCWVDEFLDFSSTRRTSHRRSASDSIAFLPLLEDCPSPPAAATASAGCGGGDSSGEFEKFDDEQIMSMFADEMPSTSTPSDRKDGNDDEGKAVMLPRGPQPKEEPQEVDSSCNNDDVSPAKVTAVAGGETICDPKRVKRILANRQSAQRSRVRKLQYISELERSVTTLQTEVSTLSPRVAYLDHQRLILNVDNSTLKQRIAALVQDKIFKDAHQEALKKEIERLRQIYREQNLNKLATSTASPSPPSASDDFVDCTDNDQNLDR